MIYTHNPKDALVENMVIIEPYQIVGHVVYYSCPVDTFEISAGITILVDGLYHN